MAMSSRLVSGLLLVALVGCGDREVDGGATSERRSQGGGSAAPPASASTRGGAAPAAATATASVSAASASASPSVTSAPPRDAPFVRRPPHSANEPADALDECLQVGGSYFSCSGAILAEQDPVLRRYLVLVAKAHVAGQVGYAWPGPPNEDHPHAEVPGMCAVELPCRAQRDGLTMNESAAVCLARAQVAMEEKRPAEARAAHALACKCDPEGGKLPGYNHTRFVCEGAKPAFFAPSMPKDQAADVLACASCNPKTGPKACEREMARLAKDDAALAQWIEKRQLPRCQTAIGSPRSWD